MAMTAPALLATAGQALSVATSVASIAGTIGSIQQGRSQAKAQAAARNQQITLQQQQAAMRKSIEDRRRQAQRKSQLATARARLGASGVGSTGGSGAALLGGINARFDEQKADSDHMFALSQVKPNLLDSRPNRLQQLSSTINQGAGLARQVIGMIPN